MSSLMPEYARDSSTSHPRRLRPRKKSTLMDVSRFGCVFVSLVASGVYSRSLLLGLTSNCGNPQYISIPAQLKSRVSTLEAQRPTRLQKSKTYSGAETDSAVSRRNNVLAFSLYGDDSRYLDGALTNARLYSAIFPGWRMRVYYDTTVPGKILASLTDADAELVNMTGSDLNPMNWRFLAASDASVDTACSRDIDSRLTFREFLAVREWQGSQYSVHVIRDHISHIESRCVMPGGTWCAKYGVLADMSALISAYNKDRHFNADQEFLERIVWPKIREDVLQHVSFMCEEHPNSLPMLPRVGMEHVGAVYIKGELRESDVKLLRGAIHEGFECTL